MTASIEKPTPTAGAVIVGDEILSGKVRDENTPFLIGVLRRWGVSLRRVVVVPDHQPAVVAAVREAHREFDYVFTSGGVGPTPDDVTLPSVAEALGRPLVRHAELEGILRALIGERLKDAHLRMADLPEGAALLGGEGVLVPGIRVDGIFILPGVPEIFREKVGLLESELRSAPFHCRNVYVSLGEGALTPLLEQLLSEYPAMGVGSYPRIGASDWRVRVSLESKDAELTEAATRRLLEILPSDRVVSVEEASPAREA